MYMILLAIKWKNYDPDDIEYIKQGFNNIILYHIYSSLFIGISKTIIDYKSNFYLS